MVFFTGRDEKRIPASLLWTGPIEPAIVVLIPNSLSISVACTVAIFDYLVPDCAVITY